jgi:hypothetical protein
MVSAALSLQAGVMPTGAEEANPQVTVVIELTRLSPQTNKSCQGSSGRA